MYRIDRIWTTTKQPRDNLRLSTLCRDYGDNKMFKLLLWELFYSPRVEAVLAKAEDATKKKKKEKKKKV